MARRICRGPINQVTERVEKKLEELEELDYTQSVAIPGQTTIYVICAARPKTGMCAGQGQGAENVEDIKAELPLVVIGPFYNDFGECTADLRLHGRWADPAATPGLCRAVRTGIVTVPDVGKVDVIGAQDEVIYLEFDPRKVANLGLDLQAVIQAVQNQNAIVHPASFRPEPSASACASAGSSPRRKA